MASLYLTCITCTYVQPPWLRLYFEDLSKTSIFSDSHICSASFTTLPAADLLTTKQSTPFRMILTFDTHSLICSQVPSARVDQSAVHPPQQQQQQTAVGAGIAVLAQMQVVSSRQQMTSSTSSTAAGPNPGGPLIVVCCSVTMLFLCRCVLCHCHCCLTAILCCCKPCILLLMRLVHSCLTVRNCMRRNAQQNSYPHWSVLSSTKHKQHYAILCHAGVVVTPGDSQLAAALEQACQVSN